MQQQECPWDVPGTAAAAATVAWKTFGLLPSKRLKWLTQILLWEEITILKTQKESQREKTSKPMIQHGTCCQDPQPPSARSTVWMKAWHRDSCCACYWVSSSVPKSHVFPGDKQALLEEGKVCTKEPLMQCNAILKMLRAWVKDGATSKRMKKRLSWSS